MICYKDKTFCDYWRKCKKFRTCGRVLTQEIKRDAEVRGLPICRFAEVPSCFEERE